MIGVIDEEMYANNYAHFQKSLMVLCQSAESQCRSMDYFNVAWEIKDDVTSNGCAVLNTVNQQLSELQKDRIKQLLKNIADLPDTVVNVLNCMDAHLRAMSDPHWVPIRGQAKHLVSLLRDETHRVHALLNSKHS